MATFTVAASDEYVNSSTGEVKQQTAYVQCVAWGKRGELVGNLKKGDQVFVEGRLNTRSYETHDGQKRYITEVVANMVGVSLGETMAESNFDSFGNTQASNEEIPF